MDRASADDTAELEQAIEAAAREGVSVVGAQVRPYLSPFI